MLVREEVRNRLLRRVDWRFFLPDPTPGKIVCFSSGLLARAVESTLGHLANPRQTTPGECDLAVAVDPDRNTLRSAWAALRPSGACYTEWYSPLTGGVPGARRRLEAAGFREVPCYWAWPPPAWSYPRFWVPLDAPGALRYFRTSRSGGHTVAGRLAQGARRAALGLGLRLDLLRPVCAVARKPTRPVAPPVASALGMNAELADAIRAGGRPGGSVLRPVGSPGSS